MRIFFWRTQTGSEVDFLLEYSGELVALEVKWPHKIEDSDITPLKRCADDPGNSDLQRFGQTGNRNMSAQGRFLRYWPIFISMDRIWKVRRVEERYGARLIRYCDDFVVVCWG